MKVVKPVYGQDYAPWYCGFSRPNDGSFLSNAIIWFQSLDESCEFVASHVFLVVSETVGIESAEKGVEFFDLQARISDPKFDVVFREPIGLDWPAELSIKATAYQMERTEKPYDYTGLFGAALRILFPLDKILKPWRKMPVPLHMSGLYCSAFASACYKSAVRYRDIALFQEYHTTRISPVLLYNHFPFKPFHVERKEGVIPRRDSETLTPQIENIENLRPAE